MKLLGLLAVLEQPDWSSLWRAILPVLGVVVPLLAGAVLKWLVDELRRRWHVPPGLRRLIADALPAVDAQVAAAHQTPDPWDNNFWGLAQTTLRRIVADAEEAEVPLTLTPAVVREVTHAVAQRVQQTSNRHGPSES